MAEYLLKGGKMLAKTCQNCGSPLFEYKGETSCVVCKEADLEAKGENKGDSRSKTQNKESRHQNPGILKAGIDIDLVEQFDRTIKSLLIFIEEEPDSRKIAELTHALKEVAETYSILNQGYDNRDNS
ncbi:MAG TPA: Sjogren's syndrome/scleroderma autoantigen 1 family protein [Methanospirillum sp.]|uniref:Sjogren's syndrome/scleroderma autoantigen 1 family protein n=1 Tax=Methanospirillum sp. TaxID=45200 RepID=UPI002B6BFDD7|nr:Sjogren's syndrome/scleroderma autoantigen 1 family protein [Methanospirillum sp.]HWQ62924.1 Sjogren's syndrome/scleroderma autoantigen 1 family protein [Methanospirillum sp.]